MNAQPPEPAQGPPAQAQESLAAGRTITHRFPLRGSFLDVRLPYDLSRAEAVRLAQFVESLAAG